MDDVLVEAFAVVREAAWRVLELRHYDVQVPTYVLSWVIIKCDDEKKWLNILHTSKHFRYIQH